MNVLVIPEDPKHDQYILKPLFERLFRSIGKGRVCVKICHDPVLGGVGEALKLGRLKGIVKQYEPMIDMFILCVDRDGLRGRKQRLREIEAVFSSTHVFFAENAWEEIETWALAGLRLPKDWKWGEIRTEIQVKEVYFDRLIKIRKLGVDPGLGRKQLGREAASNVKLIRTRCTEDFDDLANRIESALHDDHR